MSVKVLLIVVGLVILLGVFHMYSRRKLTAGISLVWMGFAVVALLFGIIPGWGWWADYASRYIIPPIIIIFLLFLFGLFMLSTVISNLSSRNRELAMHVSLLNQENEYIMELLEKQSRRERMQQAEADVQDAEAEPSGEAP